MALRNIRIMGDKVLEKVCRPVDAVTPRIRELAGDMLETMYDAYGVGLAAPQVGILKRIVVIDVDGEHPHILINPEILETSGEQTGDEGCLSLPGKSGTVTRPNYVKVRAFDLDMNQFELEGEGLLARAICHECEDVYKRQHPSPLSKITAAEAEQYIAEGQFEPGTMLPKIEAAVEFLKKGGKRAVITSIDEAKAGYLGRTGTVIE